MVLVTCRLIVGMLVFISTSWQRSPPVCPFHLSCSFDSLGGSDNVVVPLDGGHHDRSWPGILLLTGMIHFLVLIPPFYRSHFSRTTDSLGGVDSILEPQDGGHGDRPGPVLELVTGFWWVRWWWWC
jgi:hypothetical protein